MYVSGGCGLGGGTEVRVSPEALQWVGEGGGGDEGRAEGHTQEVEGGGERGGVSRGRR